jgi:hypothetical protein
MKVLIRVGIVLVLLVIVGAVAGVVMIDSIATAAVTKGAAFATQTEAECESVDVKLLGSNAEIDALDIKNPDGPFRKKFDSFLVLGNGTAEVTAGSVFSDKVVIPKVELSDITITLVGIDGKTNYETILEALKRFQGDDPPAETKDQKQVVIKELIIRNITVKYYFDEDPAIGAIETDGEVVIADDEPMVLKDVGSGGVPMSEITADIITDILVQVMANIGDDIGKHVLGLTASLTDTLGVEQIQDTLGELGIADFDLGEQLEELAELGEYAEQAGEWIKENAGVLEDIGGILGGGDDAGSEGGNEESDNPVDRIRGLID